MHVFCMKREGKKRSPQGIMDRINIALLCRGVAGSKTMCNQRTSARGLGDAEDRHRVKVGGPGGEAPGSPAFLAIRD
jgi:hypothetical protein